MARTRTKTDEANNEPQSIAGAVDQVVQNAQAGDVFDQAIAARHQQEAAQRQPGDEPPEPAKAEWKQRVGYWRDNEAGVRIEEDRRNGVSTIIFRDDVPDQSMRKAKQAMRENGWQEDRHEGGWSKKIDRLRASQSREDAENMVLAVANIIREEKGLEPKQSFYITRA